MQPPAHPDDLPTAQTAPPARLYVSLLVRPIPRTEAPHDRAANRAQSAQILAAFDISAFEHQARQTAAAFNAIDGDTCWPLWEAVAAPVDILLDALLAIPDETPDTLAAALRLRAAQWRGDAEEIAAARAAAVTAGYIPPDAP